MHGRKYPNFKKSKFAANRAPGAYQSTSRLAKSAMIEHNLGDDIRHRRYRITDLGKAVLASIWDVNSEHVLSGTKEEKDHATSDDDDDDSVMIIEKSEQSLSKKNDVGVARLLDSNEQRLHSEEERQLIKATRQSLGGSVSPEREVNHKGLRKHVLARDEGKSSKRR